MYVSPDWPLPRNSFDPVSACEAARAASIVQSMEQSVQDAYRAVNTIAGPSSFSQFGPAVVTDVARSQNALAAAGLPVVSAGVAPSVATEMIAAPIVLPLNVTVTEYSGCGDRPAGLSRIPLAPQTITFPTRAPVPVSLPQTAAAPKYKNLCWALRNAAVDRSQFDYAELTALQQRCMQLGYTGACVPPPAVALWLAQQRVAGTLPHISVRPSDLDSIEKAPPLEGVNCTGSWALAGMSGYRGMGSAWGDTSSLPCGWGLKRGGKVRPGINLTSVGLFAAAVLGLYAMGKR